MLLEAARLLAALPDDPDDPHRRYRVAAYRRGAKAIISHPEDVATTLQRDGTSGLKSIRWVGASIAAAIQEVVTTGRWAQLDALRQELPEYQFYKALPGLDPPQVVGLREVFGAHPTLTALRDPARISRLMTLPGLQDPVAAQRVRLMVAGWLILGPHANP
jgi:DNA polymerase/3'-5' exonuclease PolX